MIGSPPAPAGSITRNREPSAVTSYCGHVRRRAQSRPEQRPRHAGHRRPLAGDLRGHHRAVRREVEQLLAVAPPPRLHPAGQRHLALLRESGKGGDVNLPSPGLVRVVGNHSAVRAHCRLVFDIRRVHQQLRHAIAERPARRRPLVRMCARPASGRRRSSHRRRRPREFARAPATSGARNPFARRGGRFRDLRRTAPPCRTRDRARTPSPSPGARS